MAHTEGPDWDRLAEGREIAHEAADMRREIKRLSDLVDQLAPFLVVHADRYQRDYGLNGLHPTHYDLLAQTGVCMVDFKRASNALLRDGS